MKIPKTIKIGWRTYTVKFVSDLVGDNGEILYGETDFTNYIIYINKDINKYEQEVTFLHEVKHCIYHSQGQIEWRDNEILISANAEGLYQFIRDNPKVFEG